MGNEAASREKLIALLQLAYSGELAAAHAEAGLCVVADRLPDH